MTDKTTRLWLVKHDPNHVHRTGNVIDLDGRAAKRAGSRRRMLLAGLKFVQKGKYRFTPIEIAEKVEMHRRSFFEIFGTLDGYLEELIAEHGASIQDAIKHDVSERERSIAQLILLGH